MRHSPQWVSESLALVATPGSKPMIVELNHHARARRVETGMTPTQALARCPELRLLSPNKGHERSAQEAMLQMGENLSPFLESTARGVVTIELPPERPFREDELATRVVTPLRSLGLDVRAGVAGHARSRTARGPLRHAGEDCRGLARLPCAATPRRD